MRFVSSVHAYILHARPYRETSLMLDCLTKECGRISVAARNARGNSSRFRGACQLFSPLLFNLRGIKSPYNLMQLEICDSPYRLVGDALLCGFYVNELFCKLINAEEDSELVFNLYEETLLQLHQPQNIEIVLRIFEKKLLSVLGYELSWTHTADDNMPIDPDRHYNFYLQQGFILASKLDDYAYPGSSLLAMHQENITDIDAVYLKKIMRQRINFYLDGIPINSRKNFF